MVVFDANFLMLLLRPDMDGPKDADGEPLSQAKERVEFLVDLLGRERTKIAIPTPALSEALVHAKELQAIVETVNKHSAFSVEPFDQRAAIELAAMLREELKGGKQAMKTDAETWAKLKFDRQIVAIAKVIGATTIYTDDTSVAAVAGRAGIPAVRPYELPLPPHDAQQQLFQRPT